MTKIVFDFSQTKVTCVIARLHCLCEHIICAQALYAVYRLNSTAHITSGKDGKGYLGLSPLLWPFVCA